MKNIDQGLRLPCQKAKAPGAGTAKGLHEAKLVRRLQCRRSLEGCKDLLQRVIKLLIVQIAMREWMAARRATRLLQMLGVVHA